MLYIELALVMSSSVFRVIIWTNELPLEAVVARRTNYIYQDRQIFHWQNKTITLFVE